MEPSIESSTPFFSTKPDTFKVSIGAGRIPIQGFIRVDIDPTTNPDRVMNATKLEFPSQSVEILYASHVLEHLKVESSNNNAARWDSIVTVLKSWRECLTLNGRLYVCVPDIEKLAQILLDHRGDPDMQKAALDTIYGGARNGFDFHLSGFTYTILSDLLKEAGFRRIHPFQPFVEDESSHTLSQWPISLNLVAFNGEGSEEHAHPVKQEKTSAKDELEKYMRAADERRIEIFKELAVLRKVCAERLDLINEMDAECKRLRKLEAEQWSKKSWKSTLKKFIKG